MSVKISIIVPIYNEIKLIEKFINKLIVTFNDLEVKYILVDDGSTDGSQQWLKQQVPVIFSKLN